MGGGDEREGMREDIWGIALMELGAAVDRVCEMEGQCISINAMSLRALELRGKQIQKITISPCPI